MKTASTPRVWTKEEVSCLLCSSGEKASLYKELPGVVRCLKCGFVYTSPRITPEAAAELYSQSYFESHSSEEMGYDNYVSDRVLVEKTFNKRLEAIEKNWAAKKGRVLDVGCAAGFFLNTARQRGWAVEGVEISEYCCRYAAEHFGLKMFNGLFENYPARAGGLDLVTMWDYIEHSFVPDRDIAKAYELLSSGGLLAIATPDMGSLPAKFFRHRWMGFKEHEHLYYFSKENMSQLLRSKGFEIVHASHIGKYISMDFFLKRVKTYSSTLSELLQPASDAAKLGEKSFYCNPFDIVYLVARKP